LTLAPTIANLLEVAIFVSLKPAVGPYFAVLFAAPLE
jgi:hypothetical protein